CCLCPVNSARYRLPAGQTSPSQATRQATSAGGLTIPPPEVTFATIVVPVPTERNERNDSNVADVAAAFAEADHSLGGGCRDGNCLGNGGTGGQPGRRQRAAARATRRGGAGSGRGGGTAPRARRGESTAPAPHTP